MSSDEAIKARIHIDNPAKIAHDPAKDIKAQQDSLNKAIEQHSGDEEMVAKLRAQKDALGEMLNDMNDEKDLLGDRKDGGGAFASSLHGNLTDTLVKDGKQTAVHIYRLDDQDRLVNADDEKDDQ